MPAIASTTRDRLLQLLQAAPRCGTTQLASKLGITPQTVRRRLAELPENFILAAGMTRRARYALRRPLRGLAEDFPLYAIDATGQSHQVGVLALVAPEGALLPLTASAWPVPDSARDGWWRTLPYPIRAARPGGYLGRRFAAAQAELLAVPPDPAQWSDDDLVWVLSRRGADLPGNLVLGNDAYRLWQQQKLTARPPPPGHALAEHYVQRAQQAIAAGDESPGLAGEFPKFTAVRAEEGALTPHVLVKFCGSPGSAAGQRWADLLVCEHLALEHAAMLPGNTAAHSRILFHAGHTFLEVERFDRVGDHGRLAVCGLDALSDAFRGTRSGDWPHRAARLHGAGLLDAATVAMVEVLWWFGRLIANVDMDPGNVSFHVEHPLRLAPTYDMLPMVYAPLPDGEVPTPDFQPPLPVPAQRPAWRIACTAAIEFWSDAAADSRIGEAFRAISRENVERLKHRADKA